MRFIHENPEEWKQHRSTCRACQTGSDAKRWATGQALWAQMPSASASGVPAEPKGERASPQ